MLDGREGDDYHRWFLRDLLSTLLVLLCLHDEIPKYDVQAGAHADKPAAVLRADVGEHKKVIEHARVTLLHICKFASFDLYRILRRYSRWQLRRYQLSYGPVFLCIWSC